MEISLKGIKISIPIFQFRSIQPDFIPCNIRKYENTPLVRSRRLALACRSRGSTLSSVNSRTCSLFRPGFEFLISNFLFVVIFLAFFKISVFTIFALRKEKNNLPLHRPILVSSWGTPDVCSWSNSWFHIGAHLCFHRLLVDSLVTGSEDWHLEYSGRSIFAD